MADTLPKTPMLDELEKGKWPSFVTEIKLAAKTNPMSRDLLGLLEGGDQTLLDIKGFGRKSLIDLKKALRGQGFEIPEAAEEITV